MFVISKNNQMLHDTTIIGSVESDVKVIYSGFVYGVVLSSIWPKDYQSVLVNERQVKPGEFFTINASPNTPVTIDATNGFVTYIIATNKQGNEIVAGKIGLMGNQRYIDGCTDTLLSCPTKLGEPCLNALYFPGDTIQTFHTHPSLRCGVVLRGHGFADTSNDIIEITTGDVWLILASERHRFRATEGGLVVVAYHPDSDWGPTDEMHPMINRTYFHQ